METYDESEDLLSEAEKALKKRFKKNVSLQSRLPSDAADGAVDTRLDQLLLDQDERGALPLTNVRFTGRENPRLVAWERECRAFLMRLNQEYEHRVNASMVYEWATGIKVTELLAENGNPRPDLRRINQVLTFYFGPGYQTYICGKKVKRCYKVPKWSRITRRRPMTVTLYDEWLQSNRGQ